MELSKRLQAVADLVSEGVKVADIGCDHGFTSIYLVKSGKVPYCIAMDVNRGPLKRAREHIDRQRLSTYIETRLSDGACSLRFEETKEGCKRLEVEAAILAGMGGKLMVRIIGDSLKKFQAMQEFILQPQSEIAAVRRYLHEIGCRIVDEDMVLEDGKFYPMMKVETRKAEDSSVRRTAEGTYNKGRIEEQELYDCFGEHLLKKKHPVLKQFLEKEEGLYQRISEDLLQQNTKKSIQRQGEVEKELVKIRQGLRWFKDEMQRSN